MGISRPAGSSDGRGEQVVWVGCHCTPTLNSSRQSPSVWPRRHPSATGRWTASSGPGPWLAPTHPQSLPWALEGCGHVVPAWLSLAAWQRPAHVAQGCFDIHQPLQNSPSPAPLRGLVTSHPAPRKEWHHAWLPTSSPGRGSRPSPTPPTPHARCPAGPVHGCTHVLFPHFRIPQLFPLTSEPLGGRRQGATHSSAAHRTWRQRPRRRSRPAG